jgi:type IV pilus assembly protein PilE
MTMPRSRGFTLMEILIALVVIAILAAIAIPVWHNHLLRVRRAEARDALIELQAAQDRYFGRHARYATAAQLATPEGLALKATSAQGLYSIILDTSADGLGFLATARPVTRSGQEADTRCAEFSIDHVGQMHALDSNGTDRSADCWR